MKLLTRRVIRFIIRAAGWDESLVRRALKERYPHAELVLIDIDTDHPRILLADVTIYRGTQIRAFSFRQHTPERHAA